MSRSTVSILILLAAFGLSGCDADTQSGGLVGSTMQNIANEALLGAEITRVQCGSCHYLDKTVRKVGPSLQGVYGKAPRTRGIPVELWNETTLDAWIENPTGVYPETRMKIPGIKDAEKRAAIIEYLKQL
ncbi:cytochrome c [Mariprofundus micogutta]|uniref:Cytochrome c n=1 Tax=Mariprofundus micogutta TaxID=1921010 RepID=A0A1L8CKF5_9PROT|nr:c-type cytochrome [Mariprofundus micogutta]GAV19380.1 cytochrome c [Mariprofundus micogutta]